MNKELKLREKKWECRGLSGRIEWDSIDDLPLNEAQKACVLEWLAQRLMDLDVSFKLDIWQTGKSYDPLDIDVVGKVAHSYIMDMWDGGRHHAFNNMKQIEDAIFEEYFCKIERGLYPDDFCDWCGEKKENNNHKTCEEYL